MRIALLLTLLLALLPGVAAAQPVEGTVLRGLVDFCVRGSNLDGDGARYERYRDLGDGLFLETFRLDYEANGWLLDVAGDHAGRRDQRIGGTATRPGRLAAWFTWDQIPMLMSRDTRTLYDGISTGQLTIPDALQAEIESTRDLAGLFLLNARTFDTRSRRHIAEGGVKYIASPELTISTNVRFTDREGVIPYGGSFGHGSLVETVAPVNHRLTNVDVEGEFQRGPWLARAGYTASLFRNEFTTLTFDSPFRALDTPSASATGRHSLAPSSTHVGVNGLVSIRLPQRSRATAYVSVGSLTDTGDPIMPQTSNGLNQPAILPLDRTTVDGEARTTALNLTFTSRPAPWADARVRFRSYDYDNRTPQFTLTQRVAYDNAPSILEEPVHTEPFGVLRRNLDAEFRVFPVRRTAVAVGYERLVEDRTHRIFESTTENILRLGVDAVGHEWFTLRTEYEHAQKRGSGFDVSVLTAVEEQPGMRHFDVAARDRDRVTLLGSLTPAAIVSINASLAAGKDDYSQSVFGLRDNTHRVYSLGLDVAPSATFAIGPSYSYERYNALSRSRQANPGPQFDDPSRNWATDGTDRVHSFVLSAGLSDVAERVNLDFSYDFNRARATYTYITGAVPDRTLPEEVIVETTLPQPAQLPPTLSQLHRATADLVYEMNSRVSIGLSYWYEDYDVEDFTLDTGANPELVRNNNSVLLIGYLYRPYTANTFWGRLIYRW